MKLKSEQLSARLKQGLAPVYVVSGDESLLVAEACDAIRAQARRAGCTERLIFQVEAGFDWNTLLQARDTLSLFAERRLIELRLPTGKPGEAGARALIAYASQPPEGDVLLVICGKLDRETQRSKWLVALDQAGVVVQVWPVEPARLSAWLEQRMRARGLVPSPQAVSLLADKVEGNLLAAAQEVEKLHLLHGDGAIDVEAVAGLVAESARYTIYDLVDRSLAGDAAQTGRIVASLRSEGVEPVLLLWALTREIRGLALMAGALRRKLPLAQVLADHGVWDKRKPLVTQGLKRHPAGYWRRLLLDAGRIDRMIKGAQAGNVWDELLQLSLGIAGRPVIAAVSARLQP